MLDLGSSLAQLPDRHKAALLWFSPHRGQDSGWPSDLPDGTHLASRAKGIYKPSWTGYALSVRQSLDGPYPDKDPDARSNGTWTYQYFQKNSDPSIRDSEYTNRGLMACMRDGVPVGVFRQISAKPNPRYRILGLAAVAGWQEGYFHLEGFSQDGLAYGRTAEMEIESLLASHEDALSEGEDDSLSELADDRERAVALVVRRRGQPGFRKALLEIYGGKCAISGCDAEPALEAAHIMGYKGERSNAIANGLLLRADLHTLFNLGLLAIDPASMTVVLAPSLADTTYATLAGARVSLPEGASLGRTVEALGIHCQWAGLDPSERTSGL